MRWKGPPGNTMAEYVSESVDENGNKVYNAVGEMGGFLQVSGMKYTINTAVESTVKTDDKDFFVSVEGARRVQDVQVLNQTTNHLRADRPRQDLHPRLP